MAPNQKDLLESCEELDLEQDHNSDDFNLDLRTYIHQAADWITQPSNPIVPLLFMGVTVGLAGIYHPFPSMCC